MSMKKHYERAFAPYPDLVDTVTLREMLGGISEGFVLRQIREKAIFSFRIGGIYKIPKVSVIDYVSSEAYQSIKHKLSKEV